MRVDASVILRQQGRTVAAVSRGPAREAGGTPAVAGGGVKHPLIREDIKVIHYQSQKADNTFITSDGTSPYNSVRKWAVKRHYREDNK